MASATSNIPLKPRCPTAPEADGTLEAPLSTQRPTLVATFTEAGGLTGVRDVRIDGESIVDRKIANIELGDGLQKDGNRISLAPDSYIQFVTLTELSGQLTEAEQQILSNNRTNQLIYQTSVYHPVRNEGGNRYYFTTDPNQPLTQIVVNMITGTYQIESIIPTQLKEHVDNTTVHITAAERAYWNNKVSAETTPDVETGDNILHLFK